MAAVVVERIRPVSSVRRSASADRAQGDAAREQGRAGCGECAFERGRLVFGRLIRVGYLVGHAVAHAGDEQAFRVARPRAGQEGRLIHAFAGA